MPTRVLRGPEDIERLSVFLGAFPKFPLTVTITKGASRSTQQNRLSQRWFSDIARQMEGETHEDVRAFCKLHFGVPILRAENDAFRQSYDRTMKALDYETKLAAIKAFDLPVTRLMTGPQMTAFMDEMQRHWLGLGFSLTNPDDLKYQEEFA